MSSPDFASLQRKLTGLQGAWSGEAAKRAIMRVGVDAKKDAVQAVKADLGDQSMSGWWRMTAKRPNRKPIPIVVAFNVKPSDDGTSLLIYPRGSSAGPWRVLEEGRKAGAKGETTKYSKRRRRKSGEIVVAVYERARKRNSGSTPPKHTWSEATDLMVRRTPARVHRYMVVEPMSKLFGG